MFCFGEREVTNGCKADVKLWTHHALEPGDGQVFPFVLMSSCEPQFPHLEGWENTTSSAVLLGDLRYRSLSMINTCWMKYGKPQRTKVLSYLHPFPASHLVPQSSMCTVNIGEPGEMQSWVQQVWVGTEFLPGWQSLRWHQVSRDVTWNGKDLKYSNQRVPQIC